MKKIINIILSYFLLVSLLFSSSAFAQTKRKKILLSFEETLVLAGKQAQVYLKENISPSDAPKGFVLASPSKVDPDYYFHWVRDAALVMDTLLTNSLLSKNEMENYLTLEMDHQKTFKLTGQGEPKFEKSGLSFQGPWGRPQNDGPALRAIVFMKHVNKLLAQGNRIEANKFYQNSLPANTPIKIDLEYISHHWKELNFDLWEEVYGRHFYTLAVQSKALREGAKLARIMGDDGAADWYQEQAASINLEMAKFSDGNLSYYKSSIIEKNNRTNRIFLDCAVILSVIHTNNESTLFGLRDPKIQKTFFKILETFESLYPINLKKPQIANWPRLGTAIGRYGEDVYFGGHPWFLLNNSFAEFSYRLAKIEKKKSAFWKKLGDELLAVSLYYQDTNYRMSEQFDKNSGPNISARDLSWSYSSLISAIKSRN